MRSERKKYTDKLWREANKPRIRASQARFRERNREKVRWSGVVVGWKHKNRVMKKYGGCCVFCHTRELAILTIDHVNDDGARERNENPQFGEGSGFYVYLDHMPQVVSCIKVYSLAEYAEGVQ